MDKLWLIILLLMLDYRPYLTYQWTKSGFGVRLAILQFKSLSSVEVSSSEGLGNCNNE
jgi:hypothetical protein